MKNIYDVIQKKKADALQLAKELQALELVAPLLNDGSPDPTFRPDNGKAERQPKAWP